MQVSATVRVVGRVQGVCFRMETQREAERQGVAGWVRNCSDGSVEACFEGARERVEAMLAWCRQGPSAARVDEIEVNWQPPENRSGFHVVS